MNTWLEALGGASAADRESYRPVIFRPSDPSDRSRLEALLKHNRCITLHDQLHAQLRELVKAMQPSVRWESEALDEAAIAHLKGQDPSLYGTWVHFPWSNRLVHLLDEAEFALVRTDRNRNKITREEQALLASKRIGIIGLSVGNSAALALALERGFGELRLADFDTLDLSNLNRIRSGVHHLGVNKVVNTAREIAEIDPYLKVTAFTEGIQDNNLEAFLTEGGKLDLLIEECDSVAVKISARLAAKAHRIPVIMDTSDRGLIDVERFDLEPDRPILHGLVEGEHGLGALNDSNPGLRMAIALRIVPLEQMSSQMRDSLPLIGKELSTWPQLGSEVLHGGAAASYIGRKLLLGAGINSGRQHFDLDDWAPTSETTKS
ncbi:MAG TPA: ThiF family adenylyltransferase [Flavobacteriales bacterium]|nr:ThiF family adenylyltransferase [Flavobacteriales bacterium]